MAEGQVNTGLQQQESEPVEWWAHGLSVPRWSAREAAIVESLGFYGYTFNDSQCLGGDPYVAMTAAAVNTSTLRLATSVTNPLTRHVSVTAAAAASVQGESKGRVSIGIGRGDSALAHLGFAPAGVELLEDYVAKLQRYLRGDSVPFDRAEMLTAGVRGIESLQLASQPTESRLEWLRASTPKVPVMVTATGPRVIELAARHAEGVNLAVGADPARIRWGVGLARGAAGRQDWLPAPRLGAYVNVIVDDDAARARQLIAGEVASFARFSSMHGAVVGPTNPEDAAVFAALHDQYDMTHHFQHGSPQSNVVTDEFIDRYAIAGPASYCAERLAELLEIGVRRFFVGTTPGGVDRSVTAEYRSRFANEVMPRVQV